MVSLFWRFHNVHHTDLDLDVSTAARFHFGEMIFSVGFLSLTVMLFGIAPIMLVVFLITFEAATLFIIPTGGRRLSSKGFLNLTMSTPGIQEINNRFSSPRPTSNW